MILQLYNTLTRDKQLFAPIDPKNVRMYVCGPTVYDYAHVGNARPVVVFDVLYRLLRHIYGESHMTYARNITDIDDKIMARAAETGGEIASITDKYAQAYRDDMGALNALPPTIEPHATGHVPEMIDMVARLIERGHAYAADGHVLFNVPSLASYGKLSNRNRDEMIAGARVEVASYKKDPADFVLWKPSAEDQPGWDSPWGRGRPGWHLECSCMIEKNLGETIDIHGGGIDLVFPHHENEIAQSVGVHGAPLANYWVHNGYLTVNGEKMSKSLGNFFTVHELLEEFPGKGEAIRLTLLSAHYRQPLDFTKDGIRAAVSQLNRWYRLLDGIEAGAVPDSILNALGDDLNTPRAIAELNKLASERDLPGLRAACDFMGLVQLELDVWEGRKQSFSDSLTFTDSVTFVLSNSYVDELVSKRAEAKKSKDFATADKIRADLLGEGIILEDSPQGTTWRRG
ncbi:cysteine--tRNA ligase [Govanella unica]|uniref:Cysteine--tRNA ligase n=1 Tax=Govanella unica TaxID=2975056 RepID=A0A9X3TXM5_9PROT|nr:cysteine--tRNA ligase [Govania unica]